MRLEVLGFWGGTPERGGATSGYLLHLDQGVLMLDCGSGVMSELSRRMAFHKVRYLILSHLHFDHIADVGILQYGFNRALRNGWVAEPLPVLAAGEPRVFWDALQSQEAHWEEIDAAREYAILGAKVSFLEVQHTVPCYAVKVVDRSERVFVYSADTAYFEEGLVDFVAGADVFLCEATNFEGSVHSVGRGHMSAGEAGRLAAAAGVGKLVLTHLPSDGNFEAMRQEAKAEFSGQVLLASEVGWWKFR
ncbi:MBL fold metallo-hydrolase [Fundicoccus culcitae]|uniref:MBL fold metallo-hydrolase n=1 Tax=Fundicoccus culcitae TaxID=2969821 RepID=A0ABY5P3U6_9LACT|nr:MBL fold metallo-hydrolase [Fundicoccus culcitae]UUX33381.1 MBL fold metallo-hydrolase [Fundicoccus culcitae]